MSWTDPTASICGKLWGQYTWQYSGKSLAGSLGAFFTGALVTYMHFGPWAPTPLPTAAKYYTPRYLLPSYNTETSPVPLIVASIYGGLVAAFSEGVSNWCWNLDDNLTIPVISVVLLWIPFIGLGLGAAF